MSRAADGAEKRQAAADWWETLAENPAGEAGTKGLSDAGREAVVKRISELEAQLGGKDTNSFKKWNAGRQELSRHIEEKLRIEAERQGLKASLGALTSDLAAGRTPADIEMLIRKTDSYTGLRMKAIEADVEWQRAQKTLGEHAAAVAPLKQARDEWQKKADQEHDELKDTLVEGVKAEYLSELQAATANLGRIEERIGDLSKTLGSSAVAREYSLLRLEEAAASWRRAGSDVHQGRQRGRRHHRIRRPRPRRRRAPHRRGDDRRHGRDALLAGLPKRRRRQSDDRHLPRSCPPADKVLPPPGPPGRRCRRSSRGPAGPGTTESRRRWVGSRRLAPRPRSPPHMPNRRR